MTVSVRGELGALMMIAVVLLGGCASAEDAVMPAPAETAKSSDERPTDERPKFETTRRGGVVVTGADLSGAGVEPDSPVEVIVYEDFGCPACKVFQQKIGDFLEDRMLDGEITVEYRIVSITNPLSPNEYPSRAGNAALCVFGEAGPAAFYDLHAKLFERQPPEGTAGPSERQLTEYANDAGADAEECITGGAQDNRLLKSTEQMRDDGVMGTPTVLVDGESIPWTGDSTMQKEIAKAIR